MLQIPSEEVSAAYATLGLKKSGFDSGLDSAHSKWNSTVSAMEGKAVSLGNAIGSALKSGAMVAGAAAVGAATLGLSSFKDLESAASSAASKAVDVNGKSATEIKAQYDSLLSHVMDVSEELGASTVFTNKQVAETFDVLAAKGVKIADVGTSELLPFLDLAAATQSDLASVTDLVTGSINAFGLSMSDSQRVADAYAMGMNASSASMETYNYALRQGGAAASASGMELEEYLAIVGKLADKNYTGEQSGAALKTALLALYTPTQVQTDALEKLGLTYDQVDPRTHNFVDTLELLRSKGADIGAFGQIFTDSSGAIVYAASEDTKGIRELTASISGSGGLAHTQAQLILDSEKLTGAFELAKSATEGLYTAIGKYLEPAAVSVLNTWTELTGELREFGDAVGKGDWGKVGTMLADGIKAGWAKTKELGGQLYNWIKGVNWSGLGSYIVSGVKGAWGEAQKLGGQLLAWLKGVKWSEVGTAILDAAKQGLAAVADFVKNWTLGGALLAGLLGNDWSAFDRFKAAFNQMVEGLIDVGKWVLEKIKAVNWGDAAKAITEPISNGIKNLSNIGKQIWDYLNNQKWESIGQTIGKGVNSAVDLVKDIGSKIANFISSHKWSEEGSNLATKIKGGIDTVKGWADSLVKGIKDTVKWSDIGKDIGNFLSDGLKAIKTYHDGLKSDFESWVSSGGAKNLGSQVGTAIANAIKDMMDVAGWITKSFEEKGGGNAIVGAIRTAVDWVTIGQQAIDDFTEGFVVGLSSLGEYIKATVQNAIIDAIANSFEGFSEATTDTPIGNWAKGQWTGAAEYLRSQKAEIPETFTAPTYSPSTGWTTPKSSYTGTSSKSTAEATGITGFRSGGSLVGGWKGNQFMIDTGVGTPDIEVEKWIAAQAEAGHTWDQIETELSAIKGSGGSKAITRSELWEKYEAVYDTAAAKTKEGVDILSEGIFDSAANFDDITTGAAEEASDIRVEAEKDAADIEKKEVKSAMDGVVKASETHLNYSQVAAGVLKTGSEVGSKFLTNAGQAVAIGLDASGKEIAVIGRVAQEQFTAAGGKWLSDASQGGQQIANLSGQGANALKLGGEQSKASQISGATAAATKTTTAAQTFQQKIDSGAQTAMAAIARAGDPAQKIVIGAQYAASAISAAGQSFASTIYSAAAAASRALTRGSSGALGPGFAEGTITAGPQMALIGEDGKSYPEFVIPTKKKRWDLLYQAMRAYGIPGYAEGTSTGSASPSGEADEMKAYFGITGLASMSKQVQKILNDLKDFFRITWGIIKGEGATYWRSINTVITDEVTALRDNAWRAILDIRNTSIQANQQILSDATTQWAAFWPGIEPSIKSIHDNILSNFEDAKSNVGYIMDALRSDAISQLQTFESDWTSVWQKLISDLQQAQSQITSIVQQIAASLSAINVNVNIGGGGGYDGGGGGGGDWLSCGDIMVGEGGTCNVGSGGSGSGGGCPDYMTAVIASTGKTATAGLGAGKSTGSYSIPLPSVFQGTSSSMPWAASGALIYEPTTVNVAEPGKGPELILPSKLTKMFLNLADAGLGSGASGGSRSPEKPVIENRVFLDSVEVTNLIMTKAQQRLQLRGASPSR